VSTATQADVLGWVSTGTGLVLDALDQLSDTALDADSALPDWTRRHLLAHLASNAEALGRLLSWARTGVQNRMYASPEQRAADIETGARRPAGELRDWVRDSASTLASGFEELPEPAWRASVVTAQGRTVPASDVPWLRAREVCVHAVDLATGLGFADLPADFLAALVEEVTSWRAQRPDSRPRGPAIELVTNAVTPRLPGEGAPARLELPLPDAAAWLTGRPTRPNLPTLPRWL
jgi:maleylpyruvate isomerase